MKPSSQYLKVVRWSDEDECFIGSCPGIMGDACHGHDEAEVYADLCRIVDEWIEIIEKDGDPLPEPTAGKIYSGKFNLRIDPALHQALEVRAQIENRSLNDEATQAIKEHVGLSAPHVGLRLARGVKRVPKRKRESSRK